MGHKPSKPEPPSPSKQATVAAIASYALTLSPTSHVPGKHFNRVVQIFVGGPTFQDGIADPNLSYLGAKGLLLNNYHGLTHPEESNYVAAVSGSTHDDGTKKKKKKPETNFDFNEHTIVDLLEAKGVSWSMYSEGLPYSGFLEDWPDPIDGTPVYVRRHNPFMSFQSVTMNPNRKAKCKNFTMFDHEMQNNELPQWMFVVPDMNHGGYSGRDTSLAEMGHWARTWLDPILEDTHFNINKTLIMLTSADKIGIAKDKQLSMFALMLGSAVAGKKGHVDDREFNHYSLLSTVEDNWSLGNLGKDDAIPAKAPLLPL